MSKFSILLSLSKQQREAATKLIKKRINLSAEFQKTIDRLAAKHGIK